MPSFSQNKSNKKWSVRFRFVEGGREINKRLSGFATKKEADQNYVHYMATHENEKKSATVEYKRYDMTLNQLFEEYRSHIKSRVKDSTLYTFENDCRKHILPVFGELKLLALTKYKIFDWQKSLDLTAYRYEQKTKLRGYLNKLLNFAVMYFDLAINPCSQIETFRRVNEEKKVMKVWNIEQFNKFIEHVDNPVYYAFFMTLYYTGCRKSELFALSWQDIDFANGYINIDKTLTRKVRDMPYKVFNTPKTSSSVRKIALPKVLITKLLDHAKNCNDSSTFVFGENVPLSENTVSRKLKNYIEKCNLLNTEKIPFIHEHEFRHSHASLLISKGASIVSVSKRLGHSNIEETLNTYSHLMPNDDVKITALLDN